MPERLPVQKLHRHEEAIAFGAELEHANDVGMVEARDGFRLVGEHGHELGIERVELLDDLERNQETAARHRRIPGKAQVDGSHSALADLSSDLVAAQATRNIFCRCRSHQGANTSNSHSLKSTESRAHLLSSPP